MAAIEKNCWPATRIGKVMWSGSLWTIMGVAAARGSAVIAGVIVARILGRDAFGEFGAVESSVVMFALLANAGLSLTSSKFVARYRRTDPERAGRVLGLCLAAGASVALLIAAVGCCSATWLAEASLGAPHLAAVLRIAAAIVFFSAVNGAMNGALIGFQAFKRIARVNLLASAVTVPVMALAAMTGGLTGAVVGLLAVQTWTSAVLLVELRAEANHSRVAITFRDAWRERGMLTSFSLPALINATLTSPINWLCVAMLVNREGGYAEMGLLHAAHPWFLLMMFVPGQLANVYYPMFEDARARNELSELARVMRQAVQANVVFCGALMIALFAAAPVVLACYGPTYTAGISVMRIAVVTGLIVALQQPLHVYLVTVANMWLVTACSAVWALMYVAATWTLVPYGAMGIAGARLLAYVAFAVLVAGVAWRHWGRAAERAEAPFARETCAA